MISHPSFNNELDAQFLDYIFTGAIVLSAIAHAA